jgi:hypothetical protein
MNVMAIAHAKAARIGKTWAAFAIVEILTNHNRISLQIQS